MQSDRIVVAEVLRPRGNKGEVIVRSQTDVPGRLEGLKRIHARLADGSDLLLEVTEAWLHKDDWVLKFGGVDSIDAAARFRGADLWVPAEERGELPPGEFFRSDLLGCTVMDRATGEKLGTVEGWEQYGGPALMEVAVNGRAVLIPFAPALCEVDLASRAIRVDVPEGLLDL